MVIRKTKVTLVVVGHFGGKDLNVIEDLLNRFEELGAIRKQVGGVIKVYLVSYCFFPPDYF
jgi:hypothetical protein